jgi:chemotaxis signal transduction protein
MKTESVIEQSLQSYIDGMIDDSSNASHRATRTASPKEEFIGISEITAVDDYFEHCFAEPEPQIANAFIPLPDLKAYDQDIFGEHDVSSLESDVVNLERGFGAEVSDVELALTNTTHTSCRLHCVEIPQILIVESQKKHYGIDLRRVSEVLLLPQITEAPSLPEFIVGFTSLREEVVPVVDLVCKLEGGQYTPSRWTSVIIVNLDLDGVMAKAAVIVDAVKNILDVSEPLTELNDNSLIAGIAKAQEQMWIVLNVDKVF